VGSHRRFVSLAAAATLAACSGETAGGEPSRVAPGVTAAPRPTGIVPPGAATTTTTTDEEGRVVQVTTFEAPEVPPADLAAQRAACEQEDRAACAALADALLSAGQHLEAEEVWYRNCLAGHGPSCADLGYQYNNPFLHLAHPERALDVLTRGCEAPEHPPITCASLAERYADDARTRFGTEPDPARHRALIERACRDGHYWSCEAAGLPHP
jgi:TPR repeat protein